MPTLTTTHPSTLATTHPPTLATTHPTSLPSAATPALVDELADLLAAVARQVASLGLDDDRWALAGPALTAVVDAARRATGEAGSPIRPEDTVAPVLRLRDLARVGQRVARRSGERISRAAVAEVAFRVRLLGALGTR